MCTYVIGQGQICLCAILGITLWGSRYVYCGNATTYRQRWLQESTVIVVMACCVEESGGKNTILSIPTENIC